MSRILGNFLQYFLFFRSLFWFIYLVSEPTVLCFPDTEDGHPLKIEHFIVSSSLLPFTELETETNLKMPLQQVEDSQLTLLPPIKLKKKTNSKKSMLTFV